MLPYESDEISTACCNLTKTPTSIYSPIHGKCSLFTAYIAINADWNKINDSNEVVVYTRNNLVHAEDLEIFSEIGRSYDERVGIYTNKEVKEIYTNPTIFSMYDEVSIRLGVKYRKNRCLDKVKYVLFHKNRAFYLENIVDIGNNVSLDNICLIDYGWKFNIYID